MLVEISGPQVTPQVSELPKEMLSCWVTPDGTQNVRINFSSLSLMQECWRKTELSLVRGLRSNLESPATLFGSAIHKGLEVFYSGSREERIIPPGYAENMQAISCGSWTEVWESVLVYRAARAFMIKAEPLSELPATDKRSRAAGIWILTHYFSSHVNDPFVVMCDKEGQPLVEKKFTMLIHEEPGLRIEGFGQIDVVLRNELTGVILPCDHKTTSQLGQQFYQRLSPNFQYTFYTWGAREILGLDTNTFLVNALEVKVPPKTSRGSPPQFARQATTRNEEDFIELKRAIISTVKNFLRCRQEGYFPQSTPGPCSNYGGCQYLDICSAPAQLRENIIAARYKEIPSRGQT